MVNFFRHTVTRADRAVTVTFVLVVLIGMETMAGAQLNEDERVAAYHERNYTWPVSHYVPNTEGWRNLFDERFRQLAEIEDSGQRYEGYMQAVHAAYLVPNFTEHGFGLVRCPDELTEVLQKGIRDGFSTAGYENSVEIIDAPEQPLFIDRPDLTNRVLEELKDYAEEWSGIELTPFTAYGFRLYQNHSQVRDDFCLLPDHCRDSFFSLLTRRKLSLCTANHACGQDTNTHYQLHSAH